MTPQPAACKGTNCGSTTHLHSRECFAEHAAVVEDAARRESGQPIADGPARAGEPCKRCGQKGSHMCMPAMQPPKQCYSRDHNPPTHLYVPPGQTYVHVCPHCGARAGMSSPEYTLSLHSIPASADSSEKGEG